MDKDEGQLPSRIPQNSTHPISHHLSEISYVYLRLRQRIPDNYKRHIQVFFGIFTLTILHIHFSLIHYIPSLTQRTQISVFVNDLICSAVKSSSRSGSRVRPINSQLDKTLHSSHAEIKIDNLNCTAALALPKSAQRLKYYRANLELTQGGCTGSWL